MAYKWLIVRKKIFHFDILLSKCLLIIFVLLTRKKRRKYNKFFFFFFFFYFFKKLSSWFMSVISDTSSKDPLSERSIKAVATITRF